MQTKEHYRSNTQMTLKMQSLEAALVKTTDIFEIGAKIKKIIISELHLFQSKKQIASEPAIM